MTNYDYTTEDRKSQVIEQLPVLLTPKDVMDILTELNAEGTTIIMVTHSLKDAAFAQRTINLFDGQIVSDVKNEL